MTYTEILSGNNFQRLQLQLHKNVSGQLISRLRSQHRGSRWWHAKRWDHVCAPTRVVVFFQVPTAISLYKMGNAIFTARFGQHAAGTTLWKSRRRILQIPSFSACGAKVPFKLRCFKPGGAQEPYKFQPWWSTKIVEIWASSARWCTKFLEITPGGSQNFLKL